MSIPSFAGKLADNVRTLTGQLTENLHAVRRMIGQCEDAHRRVIDCTQQITCSFESKLDAVLAALASIRGGEAVRPTTRDAAVLCEATLSISSAAHERCAVVLFIDSLPEWDAIRLMSSRLQSCRAGHSARHYHDQL